ncbi:MAG: hypothetical protein AAF570_13120 [Bacteroidota bacterium]
MRHTGRCPKCQSDKIIPDVRIMDEGQYSNKNLRIKIDGGTEGEGPKRMYMRLRAWICGNCGFAETYVRNQGELWEYWLQKGKPFQEG